MLTVQPLLAILNPNHTSQSIWWITRCNASILPWHRWWTWAINISATSCVSLQRKLGSTPRWSMKMPFYMHVKDEIACCHSLTISTLWYANLVAATLSRWARQPRFARSLATMRWTSTAAVLPTRLSREHLELFWWRIHIMSLLFAEKWSPRLRYLWQWNAD